MKLKQSRDGERIEINGRQIDYSFWPTKEGDRGNASIIPTLFSLDPWAIINLAIKEKSPAPNMDEALACMLQARDFYGSATEAGKLSSRPLTLYYCFMNLAKALCLTRNTRPTFDKAQHGLSEQLAASGHEFIDAYLDAYPSPNPRDGKFQNFTELLKVFNNVGLAAPRSYKLPCLIPQVVPGHRLWSFAANEPERFIAIHEIAPMMNKTTKEMWLDIKLVADDLSRLHITNTDFLAKSGLSTDFVQVQCDEKNLSGRPLLCFQQKNPLVSPNTKYANQLKLLFDNIRDKLWVTIASIPPYRRYYAYLCPAAERDELLPQILSIYAIAYYLGSITRYRPHHFEAITTSSIGPRFQDFITGQPLQYLYLMASEFAEQEISRPSLI